MRKKSHVSLSLYLLNNVDSEILDEHRKAFIVGSILPDCRLSFVTTKHNMEETFDMVCGFINQLTVDTGDYKKISTAYCRRLGEITHYMADYFTFPHNDIFAGNIREHCMYEKRLKFALKEYINSNQVYVNRKVAESFATPKELCDYIMEEHKKYLICGKTEKSDCIYIVELCHIVLLGILNLLVKNRVVVVAA